jgi:hypothetical protein
MGLQNLAKPAPPLTQRADVGPALEPVRRTSASEMASMLLTKGSQGTEGFGMVPPALPAAPPKPDKPVQFGGQSPPVAAYGMGNYGNANAGNAGGFSSFGSRSPPVPQGVPPPVPVQAPSAESANPFDLF